MVTSKPPLNLKQALSETAAIIAAFKNKVPAAFLTSQKQIPGKVYELYALSRVLAELKKRGWDPVFNGTRLKLNGSPGAIDKSAAHFELYGPAGTLEYELYTDIEVSTLGADIANVTDLSAYHEIDLVVVPAGLLGIPKPNDLKLGVECKATANFEKRFVREVLGRRRELSYYNELFPCPLDKKKKIRALPTSEYWLVYIDPAGDSYKESPEVFGVELKLWQP